MLGQVDQAENVKTGNDSEAVGNAETTGSGPPVDRLRGMRAVVLLLAGLSVAVAIAAAALWIVKMGSRGAGYNSKITAMLAGGHAVVGIAVAGLLGLSARGGGKARLRHGMLMGCFLFLTFAVYLDIAGGLTWPRLPQHETPFESAPVVGLRMRANYLGDYSGTELRTNSDGHRSPEITLEKPAGTLRIVCLGDSLTFGQSVEERFSFPRVLERRLREGLPAATVEVINTGVPGFCTFQETEELKRTLKYRPDAAILLVCLNDITEKYLALKSFGGTGLGYHGVPDGMAGTLFHWMVKLRPYSSLITRVTPTRVEAERRQAYRIRNLWEEPDLPEIQEAWVQAERELDELIEVCRSANVALMIAVAPVRGQYSAGLKSDLPQDRLRRFARERGVAFLDLKPCIAAHAERLRFMPEVLFLDETHFSVTGNDVIGACVADVVLESPIESETPETGWRARLLQGVP